MSLDQCIAATWQGSDDVLAIEFDKHAHEFIDGKLQCVGQGVDVDFATVTDDIDNGLLLPSELGEQLELTGWRCRRLPAHGGQQVVGTGDEGGLVGRDELVTAGRVSSPQRPGTAITSRL